MGRTRKRGKSSKFHPRSNPGRGIKEPAPSFRQRQLIQVIKWEGQEEVPQCRHGPCLLFENTSDGTRWFACAVYRNSIRCQFKVQVNGTILEDYKEESRIRSTLPNEYGIARSSFFTQHKRYWCKKCLNYVEEKHNHPVVGPVHQWQSPLQLLEAIKEEDGEAQYWFAADTHQVILKALEKLSVDTVLCVGTPSLFESLRACPMRLRCFLLDYDERLSRFYSAEEYARYSMLVHHFYQPESEAKLRDILASGTRAVVISDPPFGALTSPVMKSLGHLKDLFLDVGSASSLQKKTDRCCYTMVFLPVFVGKHLLREDPSFSVVDYKVTYANHPEYKRVEKSPVRIFTDAPLDSFELPSEMGYKFCSECGRWVAKENQHCRKCGRCTTVFGPTYVHCNTCGRCVKPSYNHCSQCERCHFRGRCQ